MPENSKVADDPFLVFLLSLVSLWLAAQVGSYFQRRRPAPDKDDQDDVTVVMTASLTLLALVIGFTFSMAVTRYDQRKNYEEAEANAIGTEYLRAGLLPASDATRIRALLNRYVEQRISYYTGRDHQQVEQINSATAQLQNELWSAVQAPATAQPTPVGALVAYGMNDVLNSQGYTQAAWWNRIPLGAWALMGALALCANFLVGFHSQHRDRKLRRFLVLPAIVAISFLFVADLDNPRHGMIRVVPQNLISLSHSLGVR